MDGWVEGRKGWLNGPIIGWLFGIFTYKYVHTYIHTPIHLRKYYTYDCILCIDTHILHMYKLTYMHVYIGRYMNTDIYSYIASVYIYTYMCVLYEHIFYYIECKSIYT